MSENPIPAEQTGILPDQSTECGARVTVFDTLNDGEFQAALFLGCSRSDCTLRFARSVTGNSEYSADHADSKTRRRAALQMRGECVVWNSNPDNKGKDIPESALPVEIRRDQPRPQGA